MSRFKPRWQSTSDEDRLEINVIPLIDILLVVLIFITATTTFSTIEQLELKLPGSNQETIATQGNILLITHTGQYALNGRILASDDESLTLAMRNLEDKNELLIYADADARHAAVVRALEAANKAELERIHFATEDNRNKVTNMQAKLNHWIHQQWQHKGLFARLLYPLSRLTAHIVKNKQTKHYPSWNTDMPPIIIVGNIFVGGVGKTPAVISLCQQLKRFGWRPGVISRGYGAKIGPKPIARHAPLDPQQVGDEPSLIAQLAQVPIAVHPNRRHAAQALMNYAPDTNVIIADDGLQHYPLPRAIEIIVQDERGIGNGWLLPAGPLREPATRLHQVEWVLNRRSIGA